ncbi:glutamate racemase [Polaromonas sp.]|uniref:glutamate racemase n=1 Tax=Polaromonas sp. TaxID=1869339 RepID=UPI003FA7271B
MATRDTLASAKFKTLLASLAGQADFVCQPCDGLADAIERSVENGDAIKTEALCAKYTRAMGTFGLKTGQMDTLVLGCTHYPFASESLRALLGPHVQFLDTGTPVARQTRLRLLQASGAQRDENPATAAGQVRLLTTGQPQTLQAAARHWLQLDGSVGSLHF